MKRILSAFVLVLAALVPASASGVWGGTLDTAHPQVGAMYFDYADTNVPTIDGLICSGSYAGTSRNGLNDVFLLAGHCLPGPQDGIAAGDLYVSFNSNATASDISDPVSGADSGRLVPPDAGVRTRPRRPARSRHPAAARSAR